MSARASRLQINASKWLIGRDSYNSPPDKGDRRNHNAEGLQCLVTVHEPLIHEPFWQSMYKPLEDVKYHYGCIGVINENITISLGDAAGVDKKPDIKEREVPNMEHYELNLSIIITTAISEAKVHMPSHLTSQVLV
ncbi:hypothetical protein QBC47DRAFT_407816 [Echria macrotheca]|uniref:Uncharacterized protein n=1 Tax=Echria macrotheca TaxID=438768 RepID=A0AAJ0F3Q3_9PEZI|nr:hypothetical protein QBC47DRAFT_407816 [Echria macrotheca]